MSDDKVVPIGVQKVSMRPDGDDAVAIKPCPFCGRQPLLMEDRGQGSVWKARVLPASFSLSCSTHLKNPCVFGPSFYVTKDCTKQQAILMAVAHWNRRVAVVDGELEHTAKDGVTTESEATLPSP